VIDADPKEDMMATLVLHHYDASPYSEKVRAILGFKGLDWASVEMPAISPKPDLTVLTGGYRRAPVLQIGADIYCDSALIAEVLDEVAPTPPLFAPETAAGRQIAHWADVFLFWKVAPYFVGRNIDRIPDEFLADRAAMWGAKPNRERAAAQVPQMQGQIEIALARLEETLANADFLVGAAPSYADFAVYHCVWFAARSGFDLAPWPRLRAWTARIAGFGQGGRRAMAAAEAHALAAAAAPADAPQGDAVAVTAESFGLEAVTGRLVALGPNRITLARTADGIGPVRVHFPRLGYVLRQA
jgi:glutathione S-transferase